MSLAVGRAKLLTALKELTTRWSRVRERWSDEVERDFAEQYIAPLDARTRAAITAIEAMAELVDRARRECS
jgi:hypothetical protein